MWPVIFKKKKNEAMMLKNSLNHTQSNATKLGSEGFTNQSF